MDKVTLDKVLVESKTKDLEELHEKLLKEETRNITIAGIEFRTRGHCTACVLEMKVLSGEWVVVNRIYDH
jgi:hypothetical protein